MDKLLELIGLYCKERNLVEAAYLEGMMRHGQLDPKTIETLIRYHRDWLKG
jgi:hypothetical protein